MADITVTSDSGTTAVITTTQTINAAVSSPTPAMFGVSGALAGPVGAAGAAGSPGVGIASGGTSGQALTKASNTNYDTAWSTVLAVDGSGNLGIPNANVNLTNSNLNVSNGNINLDASSGLYAATGALVQVNAPVYSADAVPKSYVDARSMTQAFTGQSSVVVTHNMGRYPSVTVVDSAGDEIVGDLRYNSNNQLTVSFMSANTGTIYLN